MSIPVYQVPTVPRKTLHALKLIKSTHPVYKSAMYALDNWERYPVTARQRYLAHLEEPRAFLMFECLPSGYDPRVQRVTKGRRLFITHIYAVDKGKGTGSKLLKSFEDILPHAFPGTVGITVLDETPFWRHNGYQSFEAKEIFYKFT